MYYKEYQGVKNMINTTYKTKQPSHSVFTYLYAVIQCVAEPASSQAQVEDGLVDLERRVPFGMVHTCLRLLEQLQRRFKAHAGVHRT